uniref:Secreted protein n=1 Tax=Phakopsora pachyrhizi TaxID=170000 RepID=A0A0S1MJ12_PHAPC
MISLKFLSLLFFLVSTSQLTSARPNIVAGDLSSLNTGSDLPTDSILSGVSGSSRKQGGGLPISIPSLGNLL